MQVQIMAVGPRAHFDIIAYPTLLPESFIPCYVTEVMITYNSSCDEADFVLAKGCSYRSTTNTCSAERPNMAPLEPIKSSTEHTCRKGKLFFSCS